MLHITLSAASLLRPHFMALTSHITYQHQPVAKLSSMVPCTDTLNVLYIHYTVQLIAHNSNLMTIPSQCLIAHLALLPPTAALHQTEAMPRKETVSVIFSDVYFMNNILAGRQCEVPSKAALDRC